MFTSPVPPLEAPGPVLELPASSRHWPPHGVLLYHSVAFELIPLLLLLLLLLLLVVLPYIDPKRPLQQTRPNPRLRRNGSVATTSDMLCFIFVTQECDIDSSPSQQTTLRLHVPI